MFLILFIKSFPILRSQELIFVSPMRNCNFFPLMGNQFSYHPLRNGPSFPLQSSGLAVSVRTWQETDDTLENITEESLITVLLTKVGTELRETTRDSEASGGWQELGTLASPKPEGSRGRQDLLDTERKATMGGSLM